MRWKQIDHPRSCLCVATQEAHASGMVFTYILGKNLCMFMLF